MASKKRQSSLTTLLCLALGVILNDYQVKLLSQSSWVGQAPQSEKLGGPWPPPPPPIPTPLYNIVQQILLYSCYFYVHVFLLNSR